MSNESSNRQKERKSILLNSMQYSQERCVSCFWLKLTDHKKVLKTAKHQAYAQSRMKFINIRLNQHTKLQIHTVKTRVITISSSTSVNPVGGRGVLSDPSTMRGGSAQYGVTSASALRSCPRGPPPPLSPTARRTQRPTQTAAACSAGRSAPSAGWRKAPRGLDWGD
jgi:hypothetical protein